MKRLSFFTFLILNLIYANLLGQWEILNEGGSYRTIDFVSDDIGWIAGVGTLLKTEDGGDTWEFVSMDSVWNIVMIDFVNENTGWAVINFTPYREDEPAAIIKTTDGGQTWQIQHELNLDNSNNCSFRFHAVNETLVYASGWENGRDLYSMIKTVDGGFTWTDISPSSSGIKINSIWFRDANNGIFLGSKTYSSNDLWYEPFEGIVMKTNDGGITWEEKIIPEFMELYDLQFVNDSTAFFLAANIQSGIRGEISFCTTTDTLNSWSIVKQIGINSFYCLDDKTIFAMIQDTTKEWNDLDLMKSTDGGLTWEKKRAIRGMTDLYFTSQDIGIIVGGSAESGLFSFLSKSIDGGENWTIQKMNYPALNDIHFFDKNSGIGFGGWMTGCHGEGCGYVGDLFFTNDGGKTWEWAFSRGMIKSTYFIDEMTGYIICDETWNEDCCYKTNDGGKTWTEVIYKNDDSIELTFAAKEVLFLNQNIGWIIGHWPGCSCAAIIGTANGGESWDIIWRKDQGSSFDLNSIHSIGTEAWTVGEDGLMVKYTDENQWQVQNSITDLPLNEVFFSDQQHGWITGGYYDEDNVYLKLFKTNDGGENWEDIPDFNYHINDIFFADSLHGWAVGNDTSYHCGRGGCSLYSGIMLDTHDGGDNWNVVKEGLSAPLNAIHFKDGYGWAVGGNGLVLRTEDGINWIDQKTSKTYPNKFSLSQNYPNPFNPRTIINYELPITNDVELSVYNLLGQKVVSLVSEKQKAGYHQVEWDASGFASGVYYYRLSTDAGFAQTKKLVLMK